jgi:perosamine synthetase
MRLSFESRLNRSLFAFDSQHVLLAAYSTSQGFGHSPRDLYDGKMIPLTVLAVGEEEIAASERVLRSGMLVQGREVQAFEAALAKQTQRSHAIAVVNGTSALTLALRAIGVGSGDEVLCPALTWPSPAHAVRALDAIPVLVDVDPHEWNVRGSELLAARTARTKAAIVVDQFGNPARFEEISRALGDLPCIVDAACSLGSRYAQAPCGSTGVIATTSFHPRKVITTGEGGACLTDDAVLAERLRALRNHGQASPGVFVCASGNERMTELAAAIGRAQLDKLAALCAARQRLWARFRAALPELVTQLEPPLGEANGQTFGVLVGAPFAGSEARDRAVAMLMEQGVSAGRLSYALAELPQFEHEARAAREQGRSLRHASDIAARGMAVPLYPAMTDAEHACVVEALSAVLRGSR